MPSLLPSKDVLLENCRGNHAPDTSANLEALLPWFPIETIWKQQKKEGKPKNPEKEATQSTEIQFLLSCPKEKHPLVSSDDQGA